MNRSGTIPWLDPLFDEENMIRSIVIANVVMYVISLILHPYIGTFRLHPMAFLAPENKSLLILGATGSIPIGRFHWWWTLISANYLHGSILHIFFNMFAFNQIGRIVIREYGAYRMFVIYTVGGAFGFWVSYLAGVQFTIGASAALCSLIGATLYFGKTYGGPYGQAVYRTVGGWTIGIFAFGFLVPGINNWGHGGGLFCGVLLGMLLGYYDQRRETPFHRTAGILCVIATVGVLIYALYSAFYYRLS